MGRHDADAAVPQVPHRLGVSKTHIFFVRRFHSASNSSLSVTVMFMSRRPLAL